MQNPLFPKICHTYPTMMKDYAHEKRVCKDFEIKNVKEYGDLYCQGNKFLLADVYETFQNMCLEIYEHDLARFLTAP